MNEIPLFAPVRQNEALYPQMEDCFRSVLRSGEYILGPRVLEFETKLAASLGYRHAIGCASGTEALVLALRALKLGPASEVITPAFSFVASASAVVWAGLRPVLADVCLESACVTVETVEKCLSRNTKAVIAVDLYGRQAPIRELREFCETKNLVLIEDGAQSIGVPNSGAHIYTTSFYPTKNIGALGDAGAVLTDEEELGARIRKLSQHGALKRDEYVEVGTTGRLDALQAGILNLKLGFLNEWTEKRQQISNRYLQELDAWALAPASDPKAHVWALFTLRIQKRRCELLEFLRSRKIGAGLYYPKALHEQVALKPYVQSACPNAARLAAEVLSIPIYPELTDPEVERVMEAMRQWKSLSM